MEVIFHHLCHTLFTSAAVLCLLAQSRLTLCDSMDCSPPGSPLHGILQARILEWVPMPSSSRSCQPKAQNQVSVLCAASLPSEPPGIPYFTSSKSQILTSFNEWEKHRDITDLWGWLISVQLGVCLPQKWQLASLVLFLSSHLGHYIKQERWRQQQSWDIHMKEVNYTGILSCSFLDHSRWRMNNACGIR